MEGGEGGGGEGGGRGGEGVGGEECGKLGEYRPSWFAGFGVGRLTPPNPSSTPPGFADKV